MIMHYNNTCKEHKNHLRKDLMTMFKGMKINEVLESLDNLDYDIITISKYSDGEVFSIVYNRPETVTVDGNKRTSLPAGNFDCYFENGICEAEAPVLEN